MPKAEPITERKGATMTEQTTADLLQANAAGLLQESPRLAILVAIVGYACDVSLRTAGILASTLLLAYCNARAIDGRIVVDMLDTDMAELQALMPLQAIEKGAATVHRALTEGLLVLGPPHDATVPGVM